MCEECVGRVAEWPDLERIIALGQEAVEIVGQDGNAEVAARGSKAQQDIIAAAARRFGAEGVSRDVVIGVAIATGIIMEASQVAPIPDGVGILLHAVVADADHVRTYEGEQAPYDESFSSLIPEMENPTGREPGEGTYL